MVSCPALQWVCFVFVDSPPSALCTRFLSLPQPPTRYCVKLRDVHLMSLWAKPPTFCAYSIKSVERKKELCCESLNNHTHACAISTHIASRRVVYACFVCFKRVYLSLYLHSNLATQQTAVFSSNCPIRGLDQCSNSVCIHFQ